ncbi:hypothetical protein [Mycobacterium sp. JS623]|uniref:hypothetical protein n=1 Tax=Mycobacterium sp. JS623 TaxID=212767 RepID=UPI003FA5D802
MMLTACGAKDTAPPTTTTAATRSASQTTTTPVAAQGPQFKKWIDLQAGDCLADPPPVDPGVVMVSVVFCAIPHAAEVYLRTDVEVNAAIADVADRECSAALAQYTGGGPFAMTYLIDSNQDRTSANPLPSTVICLLQASNGGPLTGSARH